LIENKIIIKNSLILGFRLIVVGILSLATTRLLLANFGAQDFGLLNLIASVTVFFGILNSILTSTTFRFLAFEFGKKTNSQLGLIFNVTFHLHFIIAILIIVFSEVVGINYVVGFLNIEADNYETAKLILRVSIYSLFFLIISTPYQGLLTANENFREISKVEILKTFLVFSITIVFYFTKTSNLKLYAILMMLPNIFSFLFYYYFTYKLHPEKIKLKIITSFSTFKEILKYSSWLSLGTSGWILQRQGGDMIVNHFFGTTVNASIGIANQLNSVISVFARNIGQAATPQITKSVSGMDEERKLYLIAHVSKYSFFAIAIIAVPVFLEIDYFLNFWLGSYPVYTTQFCRIIIISAVIEATSGSISSTIMGYSNVKYFMITSALFSYALIPICYLLFKIGYQPTLIFWVNVSIQMILFFANNLLLQKIHNLHIKYLFEHGYIKILIIVLSLIPLILFEIELHPIVKIVLQELYLVVIILFFGLSVIEKSILRNYLIVRLSKSVRL
jgi:O-antigen/teichoic acid export membrane protein